MRKLVIVLSVFVLLISSGYAISFLEPTGGLYTPENETYGDFGLDQKAHFFNVVVNITDENVTEYELILPNGFAQTYLSDDLNPTTFLVSTPGLQTYRVISYDVDGNQLGEDSVTLNILFNYFDLYDVVEEDLPIEIDFTVDQENLDEVDVGLEDYLETVEDMEISKEFITLSVTDRDNESIVYNHTIVRISIQIDGEYEDLTIYELIPKEVLDNVSGIIFEDNVEIIREDPLVAWNFERVEEDIELQYYVKKDLKADEVSTLKTIPDGIKVQNFSFMYLMVPMAFVPAILFFFFYRRSMKKE